MVRENFKIFCLNYNSAKHVAKGHEKPKNTYQGHQKTKMKSFLTSYSQLSLSNPLRSRMELLGTCCHEPTCLLKTGLLSSPFFTMCCCAPTRCNRFTCQPTRSVSTANFSSKDFYPTQKQYSLSTCFASSDASNLLVHQYKHAKQEKRPFYPKCFPLSGNRNNPKNIAFKNEFSVLGSRKRLPCVGMCQAISKASDLRDASHQVDRDRAKGHGHGHQHVTLRTNYLPCAPDGQQTSKELLGTRAKRTTLGTHLCNARASKCSEKIPASVLGASHNTSVGTKLGVPTSLRKSGHVNLSTALGGTKLLNVKDRRVFERSLVPEKFINLLMANGEKDKARRCLTQALFSITTHCQKHNLQNNSPLEIFTNSFFKQESTESKPSTADNSLKKDEGSRKGTVQQKTSTNELLPHLPKGKSNRLSVPTHVTVPRVNNKQSKPDAKPGKSSNVLRDVGLVLLETRLDNLSNYRYSSTRKSLLYPSVKESQGLLSQATLVMPRTVTGSSTSRLNHIERVEKRLLSKQNGFFFLFVKQKGKLVGVASKLGDGDGAKHHHHHHHHVEKQTDRFKVPLSLPFCGKSFETTLNVFLPLGVPTSLRKSGHVNLNNPFLSLIRLSLKERFLISEKGFASLTWHKKVQQSYLCSALLHLVQTTVSTWCTNKFTRIPSRTTSKGNEKRYQTLPTYFLPFLPYSALFNWREKRLNPLFGFAKQSQRFLLELCKASANRSVKGTEKITHNNPFKSFPLLSCFYSARTPSFPFLCVPTPSITIKPVGTNENNPCEESMVNKLHSYKDEYVQQDTKLETVHQVLQQTQQVKDRLVLLNSCTANSGHVFLRTKSVGTRFDAEKDLPMHKQVPQNHSHSNTKDKKTPHCFTQGIPLVAKKVLEKEKSTNSVNTGVLLKGIQRVQPTLEVRRVRKGRNTFQVPSVVKQKRGEKVGIKWIIDSARRSKRKGNKLFSDSLANQLVQSFDRLGEARSKRNELLKLAESNRPFLRFRWW